ncbi:MAG TPA: immunoglobulin domain-containing protein [Candidatus Paceibacterota bacterium]|nr:immunoglobulin domain-containing protein [Candidatus Paceibacterota bacterium]
MNARNTVRLGRLAQHLGASGWFMAMVCLIATQTPAQAQAIEAWVQRYDPKTSSPNQPAIPAMAVDASGDVLVTGFSYGGDPAYGGSQHDYVTLKYSGAGVPLWTNYYNGPGNSADVPSALAVDASGNVFVTGLTEGLPAVPTLCTTVKYSPEGVPLWTRQVESGFSGGMALAVDAGGNVVVTCQNPWDGTPSDILTIKYSDAGNLLWTRRYNGPGNTDDGPTPRALATDADGNVVVTGRSGGNAVTIKYSSAGVLQWTRLYSMSVAAMALDSSGNVVATGMRDNDYATIKYSSAGMPLWTNYYNGPGNEWDRACAVAVDASDNVYVTGESDGSNRLFDCATIKYSRAGVPLWTNRYDGPENWLDQARALAVDASGNVFVTGISVYRNTMDSAFATVAYSSSGVPLWTNLYNGPGDYGDSALAVAVDANGGVFVAGNSQRSDGNYDLVTVKYVAPPIITRQPLSCTNAVGATASFSVEVAGGLPLSCQWRKDGADLVDGGKFSGVTTTNLQIANVQLADAGGYSVVVTNAHGTATSTMAQLTVVVPPSGGRLTNLSYSPETGFSFIFRDGTVGQSYRIQRSPSLAEDSWVDWMNFTYTEPNVFTDLGAFTSTNRFYRAITP